MNSAEIAAFAAKLEWAHIPGEVKARARWAFADTLGVSLAGRRTPAAITSERMAMAQAGSARLTGKRGASSSILAALVNGAAASALDFDDGHYLGGGIHPGAPALSSLLSVSSPTTTLGAFLCALTVSYEVALRAGRLLAPRTRTSEYHTSGTAGAIGAAVGAAKLLGLDSEGIYRTLCIASAHAPIARLQFSMVKESIGWGAATAVAAAELAASGFSEGGSFSDSQPYLPEFSPTPFDDGIGDDSEDQMPPVPPLGSSWEILSTYVKPYACCRAAHAALDGLLSVMKKEGLHETDLDQVVVYTIQGAVALSFLPPPTLEYAQFSFPFTIGAAAKYGQLGVSEIMESIQQHSKITDIAKRVVIMHDPQFDNAPSGNYPARVELKTSRGTYVADVLHARGSAEFPLSETELEDKFISCASTVMPVERADSLLSAILESSYGTELREFENLLNF